MPSTAVRAREGGLSERDGSTLHHKLRQASVNAADVVAAGDIASVDGGEFYAIASTAVDLAQRCKARGDAQVLDALAGVGYAVDSFVQWSSGCSDVHRAMVIDNLARAYDGLRSVPERHERIRALPAALLARAKASGSGDMDPVL